MKSKKAKQTDSRQLIYVRRNLTESMNASVDFLRANWHKLFVYSLYIIFPICIIQTIGIVTLIEDMFSELSTPAFSTFMSIMLFGLLGFVLLNAMLWTLLKLYHERLDGLDSVTGREFRPLFWRMLGRMAIAVFFILLLLVPAVGVATFLSLSIPFAFFFAYMLVSLPVFLVAPIYALENVTIFQAIKRAFSMGFRRLGDLMLLSITLIVIVYVVEGIVLTPWAILLSLQNLLTDATSQSALGEMLVNALTNFSSVAVCYSIYLSLTIVLLATAYHYGSIVQQDEDLSLVSDIENFENL